MNNKHGWGKIIIPVLSLIISFGVFLFVSFYTEFVPGKIIYNNLLSYSADIMIIFPFVFILISLFETWVKPETIQKHLGSDSGIRGYLWAILLGGTTLGPMIVALPVAYALSKKGAGPGVVFTYIGAAAVCRIPMTIFEATFLGILFTVIRYVVSIPLIVLSAFLIGKYLEKRHYTIARGE